MIWLILGYVWLFIHRPFEVWPWLAPFQIERIAMGVLFLAWMIYPHKVIPRNSLFFAFIGFFLVLMISWLLSPLQGYCQKTVEDYSKVAFFCLILATSVRREQELKILIWGFVAIMTVYMSHSLWEYMNGRYKWTMGTKRLYGVDSSMGHANSFAASINYMLPLIRPLWGTADRRSLKLALLGVLGLSVTCVVLTGSRAGFLGLVLFGLISIAMAKNRLLVPVVVLAIAAVAWTSMPEDRQNRFLTIVDSDRGPANAKASADGRLQGLTDGLALLQQRPILGYGPGSFAIARGTGFNAHNLYGQLAGELGYLGIGAFLMTLLCVVANVLFTRKFAATHSRDGDGKFSREVVHATLVTVILLLFLGWGSHNLYRYTWLWYLSFQTIALTCLSTVSLNDDDRAEHEVDPGFPDSVIGSR